MALTVEQAGTFTDKSYLQITSSLFAKLVGPSNDSRYFQNLETEQSSKGDVIGFLAVFSGESSD